MKLLHAIVFASSAFTCDIATGQTIEAAYEARNFDNVIKYGAKPAELTGTQAYMVGYAYSQLENDSDAIRFYDYAIAKDPDNAEFHFYKGLSLRYQGKKEDALNAIKIAVKKDPKNQEYANEEGTILYYQDKKADALKVFERAKNLPGNYPEPYFWVAQLNHENDKFDEALKDFYNAVKYLPESNSHYPLALASIGLLEYTHTHNYKKSAEAYSRALSFDPKNHIRRTKLVKALNASEQYTEAEKQFKILQAAFQKNELPAELIVKNSIAIDEYMNDETGIRVYRSLLEPVKPLDILYRVYVMNKQGDKIERRFEVEKSATTLEDVTYFMCEHELEPEKHIARYAFVKTQPTLDKVKKGVSKVLSGSK